MPVNQGRYIIRLASDPSKALMTPTGLPVNGSNVQLGAAQSYRALFDVTYRPDGTARIVSSRAGKSADVRAAAIQSGTNVQLYNDNGTRAQIWGIVAAGSTATYDGDTYDVYNIAIAADPSLYMAQSGSNVVLGAATGFIFTEPEPIESGGVYELRSMLDTTMALDVAAGSKTKGANVQLFKANGTNAQKVYITDEGDGWSLRSIVSGMYIDVYGATAAARTNVQQYIDNDSRAQRWSITRIGSTTVNGVECAVVQIGAFNATALVMDVEAAMTTNKTNIQIYTANASDAQAFALYPTTAEDQNMPAPSGIALAESVGEEGAQVVPAAEYVYPTWACPTSWASSGANHYEWRYARRELGSDGSWTSWGPFGAWMAPGVTVRGDRAWVTDGLPGNVDGKAIQYQIQVRTVGVGETSSVHSTTAAETLTVYFVPTVTVTGITWTRDGLELEYESDYAAGTLDLGIQGIDSAGLPIIAQPYRTGFIDPSGAVTVPVGVVNAFPSDGSTATVRMSVSTDMARSSTVRAYNNVPVTVPAGGLDIQLTAGEVEGAGGLPVTANMEATLYLVAGGRSYALGRGTAWEVPFPYDGPFEVRAYAQSGADWGVASLAYPDGLDAPVRAHGWLGTDGIVALDLRRTEDIEQTVEIMADAASVNLAGRTRPAYFFGTVSDAARPVAAVLVEGQTATWEEIEALVGTRCIYRPPYGTVRKVAVTAARGDRTLRTTNVAIEQAEVDQ